LDMKIVEVLFAVGLSIVNKDILSLWIRLLSEDPVLTEGPPIEVPDKTNLFPSRGTKSTSFMTREWRRVERVE